MDELLFFLSYIVGICLILYVAHFLSKKIGQTQAKLIKNNNQKDIHIKETVFMGPNKTLYLVNVCGEQHLLSGSKDSITYLTKVQSQETAKEEDIQP